MTNYYFIVGEASGDLHASNLIKELSSMQENATFRGFGGDKMTAAGFELTKHYKEMAFMGFWEVLANLPPILKNFKQAKEDIIKHKIDILVLVDYPGFNMRMASFAKKNGVKVVYYITPQVWAWKKSRVKSLKKHTDLLIPILPFEKEFFEKYNVKSSFYGHPLIDSLNKVESHQITTEKPIISLLPGSRKQEIKHSLPIMMQLLEDFKNYQFIIAGAPSIEHSFYRQITGNTYIPIVSNKTHALLKESKAAIVTSGTATLEAAILDVPQVVCYKTSFISYCLGRLLVKVNYISLVNIICEQEVVKELIQAEFNKERLKGELKQLLQNNRRKIISTHYKNLLKLLGQEGVSKRVAQAIVKMNH